MLLDYYYTIINKQTESHGALFNIALLPECSVYKGHFPDMPVAPGVFNIQMIKECVERLVGKPLLLESITQCKFLTMITPDQHMELQVRIELVENRENHFMTTAKIHHNETICMSFTGDFILNSQFSILN
ncbi:MAG: beta-hydroxyacyl-ACP dehydratase [Tannerella sp.]|jgi:3-hydroxyacyl-[acyl-carrier-protein] dehydratase|nr:beta-hydroxyacyl-ACP dehydratase [Tannerella sp.]